MILLLACAHTLPHTMPAVAWSRTVERKEQLTDDGRYCLWEAEQLWVDGQPMWVAAAPDNENWCVSAGESARLVDVLSQDGQYLSTRLTEVDPTGASRVRCVTWDIQIRTAATLDAYDPRLAERRLGWLQHTIARDAVLTTFQFPPEEWVVRDGHVGFCGYRKAESREIRVR